IEQDRADALRSAVDAEKVGHDLPKIFLRVMALKHREDEMQKAAERAPEQLLPMVLLPRGERGQLLRLQLCLS
ncbi:MAG TPA: hypothetical protein VJ790_17510, partial [Dongiaceae bacterium]|nr:hypothetical protein [Dongiaceae bacterium]